MTREQVEYIVESIVHSDTYSSYPPRDKSRSEYCSCLASDQGFTESITNAPFESGPLLILAYIYDATRVYLMF